MGINFETLKMGFKAYLESLQEETDTSKVESGVSDISDVSIFMHAEEFKEYVSDELNIDISDIPMDISQLMEMEIVNGELVSKEDSESSTKTEDTENKETTDNNDLMTNLLNDLFKDSEVIKSLDKDGDNALNTEEATNFLNFISANDKDEKNLSLKDIFMGIEQLKKGEYDPTKIETSETKEIEETKAPQSSSSSGGGSFNSYSNSTPKTEPKEKSYEDMSLDELNTTKSDYETKKGEAKDLINGIYSGENAAVKSAKESLEEKKTAYDEAVKNDEKISKELKTEREANLKDIDAKESSIDSLKIDINDKDHEISNLDTQITSKNSDLSALQNSLSSLQSSSSDDKEIQAQIASQKQAVQSQITQVQQEIKDLESQKTTLEEDKKGLEDNLKTEEEALAELETQRTDIESRISENCNDETKTALSEYNDAKTNVETVKTKQLETAKDFLSQFETELDKINGVIDTKNAKQIEKDNHVSTSKLFDGKSNLVAQKVNEEGTIPYILIGPENADPNEELPVLVYMHGSGEVGSSQDVLLNVGPGGIMPNWNLEDFNGYILCPQLTGSYNAGSWNNERAEGYLRDMLADFEKDHAIDKNNIAVAGHSLGGMGALYMAKHMEDVFTKAAVISGYNVGIDTSDINIPIIGYVGTAESNGPMNQLFRDKLGEEYLVKVDANHGGAPKKVFERDTDGNGRSDFIEWLFNDEDYDKELPD